MQPKIPGINPLIETRAKANESVDRKTRYMQIIEILEDSKKPLSAREISVEMYRRGYASTTERNLSHPRIHELLEKGILEVAGDKVCQFTGHSVGVFELRQKEV